MKTKLMRSVVLNTKSLLRSGDLKLEAKSNQMLITSICKDLNIFYKKNPRTVAAIVKYIEDHGYQLRHTSCEETQQAWERKEKVLENVDPKDLDTIRVICESLFAQFVRGS